MVQCVVASCHVRNGSRTERDNGRPAFLSFLLLFLARAAVGRAHMSTPPPLSLWVERCVADMLSHTDIAAQINTAAPGMVHEQRHQDAEAEAHGVHKHKLCAHGTNDELLATSFCPRGASESAMVIDT